MAEKSSLQILGTGSLADLFGDFIAYRLLEPIDGRLPGLEGFREELGIAPDRIPRKVEPAYGRVVERFLRGAARLSTGTDMIQNLVVVGDTEHNDGGAMVSISSALGCPGTAFICEEDDAAPRLTEDSRDGSRPIFLANRWRSISDFEAELEVRGMPLGEGTVVILDIDKTVLGARGRNHRPIDEARVAAVLRTARNLGPNAVDEERMMAAYHHFNRPPYHPFTTDNQDYLAYIALLVGSGWTSLDELDAGILGGRFSAFAELLEGVAADSDRLGPAVMPAHRDVVRAVRAGDPTPFKDFRLAEYRETVERMAPPDQVSDPGALLENRLVITGELWDAARRWRRRGALLFGLSDKPDEASTPSPKLATEGFLPLHRTEAVVVGSTDQSEG